MNEAAGSMPRQRLVDHGNTELYVLCALETNAAGGKLAAAFWIDWRRRIRLSVMPCGNTAHCLSPVDW